MEIRQNKHVKLKAMIDRMITKNKVSKFRNRHAFKGYLRLVFFIFTTFGLLRTSVDAQTLKDFRNLSNDSTLVFVKSGKCYLGDKKGEPDEKPEKRIKISSFYIGKYEVTNSEFAAFLNSEGNQFEENAIWIDLDSKWNDLKCKIQQKNNKFIVDSGFEEYPVNFVSWYGAIRCKRRSTG